MARSEERGDELWVFVTPAEAEKLDAKSRELMRLHYQEGAERQRCDLVWDGFVLSLFGLDIVEKARSFEAAGKRVITRTET